MPRVAVIPKPNSPVEIREVAAPELEQDSALFEVEFSEVCGTDVYLQQGRLKGVPYPLVPGHVSVGQLSKIRGSIRDVDGRELREGDRLTFLDVHRTCNACWFCLVAKATTRSNSVSVSMRARLTDPKLQTSESSLEVISVQAFLRDSLESM
jgi:L-iditol 2-dehydrogenase